MSQPALRSGNRHRPFENRASVHFDNRRIIYHSPPCKVECGKCALRARVCVYECMCAERRRSSARSTTPDVVRTPFDQIKLFTWAVETPAIYRLTNTFNEHTTPPTFSKKITCTTRTTSSAGRRERRESFPEQIEIQPLVSPFINPLEHPTGRKIEEEEKNIGQIIEGQVAKNFLQLVRADSIISRVRLGRGRGKNRGKYGERVETSSDNLINQSVSDRLRSGPIVFIGSLPLSCPRCLLSVYSLLPLCIPE